MSKVKHISLSLLTVVLCITMAKAQKANLSEVGASISTNGIGLSYSHYAQDSWRIASSISTLRHSKETRVQNPAFVNPKPYVFGKLKSATILALQLERRFVVSELTPYSPQISWVVKAGPNVALLKPYYVYVQEMDNPSFSPRLTKQTADLIEQQEEILGAADRFKGIDEMTSRLGAEFSLEFRSDWQRGFRTQGLAIGANLKLFPSDLEMIYANNSRFFASVYIKSTISTSYR